MRRKLTGVYSTGLFAAIYGVYIYAGNCAGNETLCCSAPSLSTIGQPPHLPQAAGQPRFCDLQVEIATYERRCDKRTRRMEIEKRGKGEKYRYLRGELPARLPIRQEQRRRRRRRSFDSFRTLNPKQPMASDWKARLPMRGLD
ncbi:hypothetical protein M5K25_006035 [Dendrobium thyrsiflorum]|uniref:Uncharacterized protein n=1 Tax=Dendrobium thyrsiflorum TaxID=117978 RepID=A0ABD0VBW5_DENTH